MKAGSRSSVISKDGEGLVAVLLVEIDVEFLALRGGV